MARRSGRAPSQRQLRVGETVRHALSDILVRGELHDPDLQDISMTVTEVEVSPDMRNARVYVAPLGGGDAEKAVSALDRCSAYLRGQLAKNIHLKYSLQLRFVADRSFDEAQRIENLLANPKVAADLSYDAHSHADKYQEGGERLEGEDGA